MREFLIDLLIGVCLIIFFVSFVATAQAPSAARNSPRVDTSVPWCWSPEHGLGLPCRYKRGEVSA